MKYISCGPEWREKSHFRQKKSGTQTQAGSRNKVLGFCESGRAAIQASTG